MTAPRDPRTMHCRDNDCLGEAFCACQCDSCKAAYEAGPDFYRPRAQPPHPLATNPTAEELIAVVDEARGGPPPPPPFKGYA
jgi:hypothetical protein